jgi:hypothetical protein
MKISNGECRNAFPVSVSAGSFDAGREQITKETKLWGVIKQENVSQQYS